MSASQGNPHMSKASAATVQLVNSEIAHESYLSEEGVTDGTMQFSALNRIAEATLALAFEQRTANLIAAFGQLNYDSEEESFLGERLDGYEIAKQIQERLGL
jgi:hypothetical protein